VNMFCWDSSVRVLITLRTGQKRNKKSAFRSTLRPFYIPIQRLPWDIFPPLKHIGMKLTTRCHLVTKQGMRGDLSPLPTRCHDVMFNCAQGKTTIKSAITYNSCDTTCSAVKSDTKIKVSPKDTALHPRKLCFDILVSQ
jgi:hypothetical protein